MLSTHITFAVVPIPVANKCLKMTEAGPFSKIVWKTIAEDSCCISERVLTIGCSLDRWFL